MKSNNLSIRVCMKSKRIFLPRRMIGLLGNPTHLSFWYDEENGNLLISAASKDDLDAYEIPPAYWLETGWQLASMDCDGLLVSCAGVQISVVLAQLEQAWQRPVVSSNQALLWHCLRRLGVAERPTGYGSLLAMA